MHQPVSSSDYADIFCGYGHITAKEAMETVNQGWINFYAKKELNTDGTRSKRARVEPKGMEDRIRFESVLGMKRKEMK